MAKGSSSKNDLIQILIFTFFLCAIFFGSWGSYHKYRVNKFETQRKNYDREVQRMAKDLKDDKNRQAVLRYKREKEMRQGGESSLLSIVNNVANQMPKSTRPVVKEGRSRERPMTGIKELEYSCKLETSRLKPIIQFVQQLESERPDISITRLSLVRKRPRTREAPKELPDTWGTDNFVVITYLPVEGAEDE